MQNEVNVVRRNTARAMMFSILVRKAGRINKDAVAYLLGKGVSMEAINLAIAKGHLRFLPEYRKALLPFLQYHCGKELLKNVGIQKKDCDMFPSTGTRPILWIYSEGTCGEFLSIQDREHPVRLGPQDLPVLWEGDDPSASSLLVDSVLDLLLAVTHGFKGNIIVKPEHGNAEKWHLEQYAKWSASAGVIVALKNDKFSRRHTPHYASRVAAEAINRVRARAAIRVPAANETALLM